MKVYIQIVEAQSGIYQTGMIDEPVSKGHEVSNALAHFGVRYGDVEWNSDRHYGTVSGTTKMVSVICVG